MERVPVLRMGEVLLVTIQIDLQDHVALALQDDLSARIVQTGARGVLIDISGLEIVDSFIGRMLATMASISRLLDAETVVVGMRPAVAITLVELGLSMGGVRTALDMDKGLAMLGVSTRRRDEPDAGRGQQRDEGPEQAPTQRPSAGDGQPAAALPGTALPGTALPAVGGLARTALPAVARPAPAP